MKALLVLDPLLPDEEPDFTFTNGEGFFRATGMCVGREYLLEPLKDPGIRYRIRIPIALEHGHLTHLGVIEPESDFAAEQPEEGELSEEEQSSESLM